MYDCNGKKLQPGDKVYVANREACYDARNWSGNAMNSRGLMDYCCGTVCTVASETEGHIILEGAGFFWSPKLLTFVEAAPAREMTVTQVSKALGYQVKIISGE